MKIYDYASNSIEVELPDKPIRCINVFILSGDETGFVEFEDRTTMDFDAADDLYVSYDDGFYCIKGNDIKKWLEFEPSLQRSCASYERQDAFRGFREDNDDDA